MPDHTFAFVDLAGYTALTDAHGDDAAAQLADRFCELTRAALQPGVVLVKTIGDAAMLASPDPLAGLLSVRVLLDAVHAEPDFPLARGAVHVGGAVARGADWFGSGVNIAARVCALAAGRQLLVTHEVLEVARSTGWPLHDLGVVPLRGVARAVQVFSVDLGPADPDAAHDPVCRMTCDRREAAGHLRYADQDFWFCSLSCAALFAADPETYARALGAGTTTAVSPPPR